MTDTPATLAAVREVLRDHIEDLVSEVALDLVALGSKAEWSMEDNFATTEGIARLADVVGLPSAGDQSDSDLAFWREIADAIGFDYPSDDDGVIGGAW